MFKKLLLLAFLISSPAFADDARDCDITIEFGSYTQTIDSDTYAKIMDRIVKTPEIAEKHAMNLGSQGQRTLCLTLAEGADAQKIYDDLKNYIPPEAKEGWEKISLKSGPSFQTRLNKKFVPYAWEND